jgi:hypothetical protein
MIKRLNEFNETEDRSSILFDKFYKKVELFRDLLIDLEHDRKIEKYYFYYAIDLKFKQGINSLIKTSFSINEDNLKDKISSFINLILLREKNITGNNFKLEGKLSIEVIYEKRHQDITDDLLELTEVSNSLKGMGIDTILSLGNDAKIRLRIIDDKFL